jgi:hypothetical protein
MEFASLRWMEALQKKCNAFPDFNTATMWSDVKIVFAFGDKRYWLKLYRGKIIDLMEYLPMKNALGYDIIVSGPVDVWKTVHESKKTFWEPLDFGHITIDGNMLECNRMHEAICLIGDIIPEVQ